MCSFIGAQAQIDVREHGGRNPLVEMAQSIDILAGQSAEEQALAALRGDKVADRIEDDPRLARTAADPATGTEAANATGSYEAFVKMMGGGVLPPPPDAEGGEPG